MAFDVTNPIDVASLKTELTTDPISVGYNLNGSISRNTSLINDAKSNPGGETDSLEFTAVSLMDALDPTDYESPQTTAGAANYVHTLVELQAYGSIEPYKSKFASMFASNSNTVSALNAQTRLLSRAEVLFGTNTVLSQNDLATALGS